MNKKKLEVTRRQKWANIFQNAENEIQGQDLDKIEPHTTSTARRKSLFFSLFPCEAQSYNRKAAPLTNK